MTFKTEVPTNVLPESCTGYAGDRGSNPGWNQFKNLCEWKALR